LNLCSLYLIFLKVFYKRMGIKWNISQNMDHSKNPSLSLDNEKRKWYDWNILIFFFSFSILLKKMIHKSERKKWERKEFFNENYIFLTHQNTHKKNIFIKFWVILSDTCGFHFSLLLLQVVGLVFNMVTSIVFFGVISVTSWNNKVCLAKWT